MVSGVGRADRWGQQTYGPALLCRRTPDSGTQPLPGQVSVEHKCASRSVCHDIGFANVLISWKGCFACAFRIPCALSVPPRGPRWKPARNQPNCNLDRAADLSGQACQRDSSSATWRHFHLCPLMTSPSARLPGVETGLPPAGSPPEIMIYIAADSILGVPPRAALPRAESESTASLSGAGCAQPIVLRQLHEGVLSFAATCADTRRISARCRAPR